MGYLQDILQLVAGLGIFNVWLLRPKKQTSYRGGNADNMKEEFAHYGLPAWSVGVIGFFKLVSATGLILGIFLPMLALPSAILLAVLMAGALSMHLKVGDPFKKSIPALGMLIISLVIAAMAGAHRVV